MNLAVLLLCLVGYTLMAALPLTFFRRGRMNARWLATAAPFFVAAATIAAALAGLLPTPASFHAIPGASVYAAVVVTSMAIALMGCTVGVHRDAVSLWHQDDDTPASLVTRGPYALVRHPFYTSFLLLLAGTACALPHPMTLAALVWGWIQLERTARREERRLLASPHGQAYAALMARTGRFLPRLPVNPAGDA